MKLYTLNHACVLYLKTKHFLTIDLLLLGYQTSHSAHLKTLLFFFVCTHTSTSVCFSAARLYQRHHTGPAELWTPPGTQGLTEVQSGRLPLPGLLTVCRRLSWTTVPTCWRRSTLKKRKLKKTVQLSSLTWWRMCCFLFNHFTKCVYWFYHKTCLKNVKLKRECITVNMLSEFSLINESYCSLLLELLNRKNVNYSVRLLMLTCTGYKLKYLPHVLHFCVTCTDNLLINTDVGN